MIEIEAPTDPPPDEPIPRSVWALLAVGCVVASVVVVLAVRFVIGLRSDPPLSVAEWAVKADAICAGAQVAADADRPPPGQLPGAPLRNAASRTRTEVEALRALPRAPERRAAIDDYFRTLDRRNEVLDDYADALDKAPVSGPAPPIDTLAEVTSQAITQAGALGIERCGAGVDASLGPVATTTTTPGASTPVPTAIGGQPEDEETTEDQLG